MSDHENDEWYRNEYDAKPATDNGGYAALVARVKAECDRYGLPFGASPTDALEGLLRHIYANHDATVGNYKAAAELALQRLADVWEEGQEAGKIDAYEYTRNPYRKEPKRERHHVAGPDCRCTECRTRIKPSPCEHGKRYCEQCHGKDFL